MSREIVRKTARFAGLLLLIAFTVELVTRIDDLARFGVPLGSHTQSMSELLVSDSLGTHARAGTQFRQFRINRLGFRGSEIAEERLRSTTLVVVSGASESFGLYESSGREWPRQLEDSLRQACTRDVTVGNAAFAGMSLPTVTQDIVKRIAPMHPAVIVYYPTPMQYLEPQLPVAATPSATAASTNRGFRLRAGARFRDAVKRVIPAPVLDRLRQRDISAFRRDLNAPPVDSAPTARLDRFEEDLRQLVGTIRSVPATPVLVVHQNRFFVRAGVEQDRFLRAWERFYPLFTGDAILQFDRLAGERTRTVARDSGVLVVDPATPLGQERPTPFADFSHFTDRGAAIVAGSVARALTPSMCNRP